MCENLIYSIRKSGCVLPIRLIHFGGTEISSDYIHKQVEFLHLADFSDEAKHFIIVLRTVLTNCPLGFLFRFLAWFSDWEEFIYSDNDVVALCNWEILFTHLSDHDLVHADEEYTTKGRFNYDKPESVKVIFGENALESAITAGHIAVKRNGEMVADFIKAIEWFHQHSSIPKKHDQALLHIASLIGSWKMLNLCKPPHSWLSSWSGDYENSLQIIQSIQTAGTKISHIHYSGGTPRGNLPLEELLLSSTNANSRLFTIACAWFRFSSKYEALNNLFRRAKRFLKK